MHQGGEGIRLSPPLHLRNYGVSMIDPKNVTNYSRTDAELQEYFLFTLFVANKPAMVTARKLAAFLDYGDPGQTPFETVTQMIEEGRLRERLEAARVGQYVRLEAALRAALLLDLRKATVDDLMAIPGVGPKTARFFLLHSRPNARVAVLDTHILKHLRNLGYQAPKATPQSPSAYARLERAFIEHAEKTGADLATLDLDIWTRYAAA